MVATVHHQQGKVCRLGSKNTRACSALVSHTLLCAHVYALLLAVGGAFEPTPRTDNGSSGGFEGPIVLNLAMAGASAGTAAGGGNIVYRSMQSMDGGPGGQFPSNMTD